MLESVLQDLQADQKDRQLQALNALQGLTKNNRKNDGVSFSAVQTAYREAGGFPLLVGLIETVSTPKYAGQKRVGAVATAAIDALATLTRNNPDNRRAAIQAGAVPALCNVLGSGEDPPVSIEVLKALYILIAPDASGYTTTELFASGGVHALIRLLRNVLNNVPEPHCSHWTRELMALLYPLARRSRLVAHLLVAEMSTISRLLTTCTDPLSLSLALDIMEEMLVNGDRRKAGRSMAREGAISALVRAMQVKGLGGKVVLVLAALASDAAMLHVLRAVVTLGDVTCLCNIAVMAASANDLDGSASRQLIEALMGGEELGILRLLVLGRCIGACLSLPSVASTLLDKATSETGIALVENLPSGNAPEVAIAAAQLLPHCADYNEVLVQPHVLKALVVVVLDESMAEDNGQATAAAATNALAKVVRCLPESEATTSAEHIAREDLAADRRARHNGSGSFGVDREGMWGSGSLGLVAREQGAEARSAAAAAVPAHMQPGDSQSYDTVMFHVGGREFYALAWVLEQSSQAIANTLRNIDDPANAAVVIPDVEGISPQRMYEMFALAVEFAYTGHTELSPQDVLDLWAVAASLQMPTVQMHCEQMVGSVLQHSSANLETALQFASMMRSSGTRLRDLCVRYTLDHLLDLRASGVLSRLIRRNRSHLLSGMMSLLHQRLTEAIHRPRSSSGATEPGPEHLAALMDGSAASPHSGSTPPEARPMGSHASFSSWADARAAPEPASHSDEQPSTSGAAPQLQVGPQSPTSPSWQLNPRALRALSSQGSLDEIQPAPWPGF
ncbi:hypothetical protein WJX72_001617 [[Myrmecia] bisecta]|uniref:BTB domain-containing protein n=1 Tax=[Myrmecia] bisecta TaxID=41462 RepID=A0AAW1QP91_9CHLO